MNTLLHGMVLICSRPVGAVGSVGGVGLPFSAWALVVGVVGSVGFFGSVGVVGSVGVAGSAVARPAGGAATADEVETRKMMALGHELRTDDDIDAPLGDGRAGA